MEEKKPPRAPTKHDWNSVRWDLMRAEESLRRWEGRKREGRPIPWYENPPPGEDALQRAERIYWKARQRLEDLARGIVNDPPGRRQKRWRPGRNRRKDQHVPDW